MTVTYETDGPVAIVSINRPASRNAVDADTAEALFNAFRTFDSDDALAPSAFHRFVITRAGQR